MPIHQRHLQYLTLKVFKSLTHLNPEFMWSYCNENAIPYNLRKGTKAFLPLVKSFRLGLNSSSIKNIQTINEFKGKLNQRIWEIFTVNVVYIVEMLLIFFSISKFLIFFVMYISQIFIY